jgi:rhamnulokinase
MKELFASIYHSLALSYDKTIKELENNLGTTFKYVYIVGGGANNKYLNKLTEKYTGREVVALPIEATSLGNIKIQLNKYSK